MLIVDHGWPNARIVLGKGEPQVLFTIAQELQGYICRCTGATLEVTTWQPDFEGNTIHIGTNPRVAELGVTTEDLGPEGFRIWCSDRDLVLLGKDDLGQSHATYAFLERFCGVRWLWPGESGEVVPKFDTLEVEEGEWVEAPSFRMRHLPVMSYRNANEGWPNTFKGRIGEWRRRQKLGGQVVIQGVHAFGSIAPPRIYYREHPEYYALVNGIRGGEQMDVVLKEPPDSYLQFKNWQLCTTNPDVIDLAVKWVQKKFDESPSSVVLNISPNDGLGFCECDRCRALDPDETTTEITGTPHPILSDRIFTFVKQIAQRVSRTHPDRLLSILAYSFYRFPPRRFKKLEDNLIVQFCILGFTTHYHKDIQERDRERLRRWREFHPQLAIYEYLSNNHWPCIPRPVTQGIAQAIPEYCRAGARYFFGQSLSDWATNGVNYYLAAKLLWNCEADPEQILGDYFHAGFGAAAEAIRDYFNEFEQGWKQVIFQEYPGLPNDLPGIQSRNIRPDLLLTPELMERCEKHLMKAEHLADSAETKERVAFVRKGFEYTKLHYRAMRAVVQLICLGVPLSPSDRPSDDILSMAFYKDEYRDLVRKVTPQKILALIDEAIQIWEERERFLESVKDDIVVDYRWVKMCDAPPKGSEGFPFARVLEKLRKAKAQYESLTERKEDVEESLK